MRSRLLGGLLLALAAGAALARAAADDAARPHAAEGVAVSFFALGDTGTEPRYLDALNPQIGVAEGMVAEDRRRPVQAVVFLGDNFYPDGLESDEMVARIRSNLVLPYCHFVSLAGRHSPEVADACSLPSGGRAPTRPLYAVLGNHDHGKRESPRLQRERVRDYVANWYVPFGPAEALELGEGVSLVLADSQVLYDGRGWRDLQQALLRARGPWRILALHHPLVAIDGVPWERDFLRRMERAFAAAAPVQLVLSGHEHYQALLEVERPRRFLQAIAGGGHEARNVARAVREWEGSASYSIERTGFARVDLVRSEGDERLRVTFFGVERWPILPASPEVLASWSVDLEGRVRPDTSDASR